VQNLLIKGGKRHLSGANATLYRIETPYLLHPAESCSLEDAEEVHFLMRN